VIHLARCETQGLYNTNTSDRRGLRGDAGDAYPPPNLKRC